MRWRSWQDGKVELTLCHHRLAHAVCHRHNRAYAIREIFPALPVIVLTAYGHYDVEAECLRQGRQPFLEKPLDTAQLLAAIAGVFAPP